MLNFRVIGEGKPLVLLHGLFGSLENLGGIARRLAEHFCVYSVDLPNHGRSAHISGATLAVMAGQVLAWMDSEGLSSVYLLGHSLGGKVAMEVALSEPSRVARLAVLDISPVAYPPRHDDVFAGLRAIDLQTLGRRQDADGILAEYVAEAAVRTFLLKNLVKDAKGFTWRVNLTDIEQHYSDLIRGNRVGVYPDSVLFIKGDKSDYITAEHSGEILSRFPAAQFKVVTNADHWLHAEKPEVVAGIIKRFFGAA